MSVANVKKQILDHVDPGEIIGWSNCIHFVVFLGESGDGKGFYCLSYGAADPIPKRYTIQSKLYILLMKNL